MLAALAFARPSPLPAPVPVPFIDPVAACALDVPEGFAKMVTGYGSAPDPATAMQFARDDARRAILHDVCAGKSVARCEVLARHVAQWKEAVWIPQESRACAHWVIATRWIDDDRGDVARLEAELRRLAADVNAALPADAALWLQSPKWEATGCDGGGTGAAILGELRNALAPRRVASVAERGPALALGLAARGPDLVISATLSDSRGHTLLRGFSIPADVFGDTPSEACRGEALLGLDPAGRPGPGGLSVELRLGSTDGWCDGDEVEPELLADQPSVVRVFSVERDGDSWLVWDGAVDGAASFGSMTLYRNPDGGDERLVAVAAPSESGLGVVGTWRSTCRVEGGLTSALLPKDAALATVTYAIQPADAPACLRRASGPSSTPAVAPVAPACR